MLCKDEVGQNWFLFILEGEKVCYQKIHENTNDQLTQWHDLPPSSRERLRIKIALRAIREGRNVDDLKWTGLTLFNSLPNKPMFINIYIRSKDINKKGKLLNFFQKQKLIIYTIVWVSQSTGTNIFSKNITSVFLKKFIIIFLHLYATPR